MTHAGLPYLVEGSVHQSWQKKLLRIFRNKDRGEESTTERESLPWWIEGKNPAAASSSQKFNQKAPNSNFLQEHQNCPHLPKMPKISKIIQFTEPKPPPWTTEPLPATPHSILKAMQTLSFYSTFQNKILQKFKTLEYIHECNQAQSNGIKRSSIETSLLTRDPSSIYQDLITKGVPPIR